VSLRHKHTWYVTAIQVEHFTTGDATNVLHRCDCGKAKVETLQGGWTASQLGLTIAAGGSPASE